MLSTVYSFLLFKSMEANYKGLSNGIWYKVFKISDYDPNIGLCKDGIWGQFVYCTFEKIEKSNINIQLKLF